ncbi:hypothetical protein [Salinispora arenicola]|uniref:hypothetical protein n=1 Tax=Salinispora arenicola TaxID=168697 RepID=UPI0027DBAFE4|nr:hypothetical protein [Salinispora arenicola]
MRDWYAELVDRASATGEDWTVAITLLGEWVQNARQGMRQPTFASERTTRFLGDAVRCPRVDEQTLVRYLDHLAATGFLARRYRKEISHGWRSRPRSPDQRSRCRRPGGRGGTAVRWPPGTRLREVVGPVR